MGARPAVFRHEFERFAQSGHSAAAHDRVRVDRQGRASGRGGCRRRWRWGRGSTGDVSWAGTGFSRNDGSRWCGSSVTSPIFMYSSFVLLGSPLPEHGARSGSSRGSCPAGAARRGRRRLRSGGPSQKVGRGSITGRSVAHGYGQRVVGDGFLESLTESSLYSIGASFCDRSPDLVEDLDDDLFLRAWFSYVLALKVALYDAAKLAS